MNGTNGSHIHGLGIGKPETLIFRWDPAAHAVQNGCGQWPTVTELAGKWLFLLGRRLFYRLDGSAKHVPTRILQPPNQYMYTL